MYNKPLIIAINLVSLCCTPSILGVASIESYIVFLLLQSNLSSTSSALLNSSNTRSQYVLQYTWHFTSTIYFSINSIIITYDFPQQFIKSSQIPSTQFLQPFILTRKSMHSTLIYALPHFDIFLLCSVSNLDIFETNPQMSEFTNEIPNLHITAGKRP